MKPSSGAPGFAKHEEKCSHRLSHRYCHLLRYLSAAAMLDTAIWLEEDLEGVFDIPVLGSILR
jgi:hypothetical protein